MRTGKIKSSKFIGLVLFFYFFLPSQALTDEITPLFTKDLYAHAHVGIHVMDTRTGESVYALNGDKLLYPASLVKVFGAVTAQAKLGENFKLQTSVYRRGLLDKKGTLKGDLLLVPQGDFLFTRMDWLAQKVKALGIKRIEGEVVVDDRHFPPYQAYSFVAPGRLLYTVSPSTLPTTQISVTLSPTQVGKKAKLDISPSFPWPRIVNDVQTVSEEGKNEIAISWVKPGKIHATGTITMHSEPVKETVAISEPADYFRFLFIRALTKAAIKVNSHPLFPHKRHKLPPLEDYGSKIPLIATYESPPLMEYLKHILGYSYNPGADIILLILGRERGRGTMEEGMREIKEFLEGKGLDLKYISLADGSGISPANLITPRFMTSFLFTMAHDDAYKTLLNSLPIMGESGTLHRMAKEDTPIKGKVRAKTGTFNQYDRLNASGFLYGKSLAGYLTTSHGRSLAFCAIVNYVHPINLKKRDQVLQLSEEVGEDLVRMLEILYQKY